MPITELIIEAVLFQQEESSSEAYSQTVKRPDGTQLSTRSMYTSDGGRFACDQQASAVVFWAQVEGAGLTENAAEQLRVSLNLMVNGLTLAALRKAGTISETLILETY